MAHRLLFAPTTDGRPRFPRTASHKTLATRPQSDLEAARICAAESASGWCGVLPLLLMLFVVVHVTIVLGTLACLADMWICSIASPREQQ
jgi:hypothetical protein